MSLRGKTLTDAVHLLQNAGDTVTVKITRPANGRTHNGEVHTVLHRDLHGDGDHGNPAESAEIPRGWKLILRRSRRDGKIGLSRDCCGDEKTVRD